MAPYCTLYISWDYEVAYLQVFTIHHPPSLRFDAAAVQMQRFCALSTRIHIDYVNMG
jgi:hypothetical protein